MDNSRVSKFVRGLCFGIPISAAMWAGIFAVSGCATTTPDYEICNTPNCGDNVSIEVDK